MVLLGGGTAMLAGALYYMVSSTLAISALFLMVDLLERNQGGVAAMLAVTAEAYGFGDEELDADEPTAELALPGTMTVLGLCFAACALLLAGLPPLSGFVGKFALFSGMLNPGGLGAGDAAATPLALGFMALVIFSGLAALVALLRVGIQTFWVPSEEEVPKVLRHRDRAGHRAPRRDARAHRGGAPGHALHAGDGRRPASARGLRRGRARRAAGPGRGGGRRMSRLVPYPLLTAGLILMWLVLNRFSAGHLLLGTAVAIVAGKSMSALQPAKPRIRRWDLIPRLFGVVVLDILRSNLAVATLILTGGRHGQRRSGFVEIPLALRDPTALAILAVIVTATPGTAWMQYDARRDAVLLHVFDLVEEADWIRLIKGRYESLLLEIFE